MERSDALSDRATASATPARSFVLQFRDSFLQHWQVERDYALAVAEAMPAEDYSFRPNAAVWTFGEHLVHMAWANTLYFSSFGTLPPAARPAASDKETVRQYVVASFAYVAEVLSKLSESELLRNDLGAPQVKPHTGVDVCLRAYTHTAHHRGQAIVYLRMKGIAPPAWVFQPTA